MNKSIKLDIPTSAAERVAQANAAAAIAADRTKLLGLLREARERIPSWATGVNDDLLKRIDSVLAASLSPPASGGPDA